MARATSARSTATKPRRCATPSAGSAGIAVGMATNVPPHNLSEVLSACIALIDDPELGFDELMRLVPGPDFPTAGIINGAAGIVEAYRTGRGRILVRARCDIESDDN